MAKVSKPKRGFAALSPERQQAIASLGGKAIPAEKRAFTNRKLASKAGSLGGKSVKAENRSFSTNRELAVSAGRKGGLKSQQTIKARSKDGRA